MPRGESHGKICCWANILWTELDCLLWGGSKEEISPTLQVGLHWVLLVHLIRVWCKRINLNSRDGKVRICVALGIFQLRYLAWDIARSMMKENNLNSQYGKVWTCSWRIIIDKLFLLLGELLELVTELYDSISLRQLNSVICVRCTQWCKRVFWKGL